MRMETSATCRSDLLSADDAVEQYGAREHLHTNCDVDTIRSGDGNLLSRHFWGAPWECEVDQF